MTYEGSTANSDGVMNWDMDVFTAPADGVYYFAFNAYLPVGTQCWLKLLHNDKSEAESYSNKSNPMVYMNLNLTVGDKVSVVNEMQIFMVKWLFPTHFSLILVSALLC